VSADPRASGASDLQEIQQAIYRYGWCIDHRDFDALDAVFTPEAEVHYNVMGGTRRPWSEMKDFLRQSLQLFRVTQHNMSNPMVELDGDRASSRTYGTLFHVQHHQDGSSTTMTHHAVYTDAWVRTEAGWRIASRRLDNLYMDGRVHGPDRVKTYPTPEPY
jgi:3-phenylpropionate/cinnamic acid dioxygenase small subunit